MTPFAHARYTGKTWAIAFSYLLWGDIPRPLGLAGMQLIAAGRFMLVIDTQPRRPLHQLAG